MGQSQSASSEHLRLAQQCFQAVGSSAAECDTIPGEPPPHLVPAPTSCHFRGHADFRRSNWDQHTIQLEEHVCSRLRQFKTAAIASHV